MSWQRMSADICGRRGASGERLSRAIARCLDHAPHRLGRNAAENPPPAVFGHPHLVAYRVFGTSRQIDVGVRPFKEAVWIGACSVPAGQPGASPGRAHRHSGFVVGYVIDGQLRFAINNEPERVVQAGGTFFEPIGALHSTNGATPGAPVRFLAFLVVPKGSPVVTPA
jgi:hypothetical protein